MYEMIDKKYRKLRGRPIHSQCKEKEGKRNRDGE
jgi:hypothetical protein